MEKTLGVGFKLRIPPAKQQGPWSKRQPRHSLPYGEQRVGWQNGKRCVPEKMRIGAEIGSQRRVYLSRMQLPEASFVPILRWALGGSLPGWLRVGC